MLSTALYGLFGFLVGVLINRAAENLPPPARRSVLMAPRCRYCDSPREPLEQIGILSYLLLRGHCHNCHSPLPLRAPIVEIASALLFAFLWDRFGPGWTLISYSAFAAILLLMLVIDLEHRLILNVVVLPATLLALVWSPITLVNQIDRPNTPPERLFLIALLGAAAGYGIVYLIYLGGALFVRMMNRGGGHKITEVAFGFGDVRLAGLAGALVGFPTILFVLFYAILLGGIGSFVFLLFQLLVRRRNAALMAIPYGPYIILATWFFMLWGREIVRGFVGG